MATIGIMRHGRDNDYLFATKSREGDSLENVSVYHDNSSSILGTSGPWRHDYEKAVLLNEGTVLATPDLNQIFSGTDQFPMFEIPFEKYSAIMDHTRDVELLTAYLTEKYNGGFMPLFGMWLPPSELTVSDPERKMKYDFQMGEIRRGNIPQPSFLEYDRILTLASELGFNGGVVNGTPRATLQITSLSQLLEA